MVKYEPKYEPAVSSQQLMQRESERVLIRRECRRATHKLPVVIERGKERANYARQLALKCFNKFWMLKVMNASTKQLALL